MLILEISLDSMMRRTMIPKNQYFFVAIKMKLRQMEYEVFKTYRTRKDCETKFEKVAIRSTSDKTNSGVVMPTGSFKKSWRNTNR